MKKIVLIIFLLNFYCSASSEIIDKYYIKKAKDKVEHLSGVAKNSIQGINNDMFNESSLLTVRNIKLSKTLAGDVLTSRENLVLDAMEDASLILIKTKKNFTCSDIITKTPATKILMQLSECLDLNNAIKYFYDAGVYGISIPKNDILDFRNLNTVKRQKIVYNEIDNSKIFLNTIRKNSINNAKMEQKIKYMNDTSLYNLCIQLEKLGNNTLTSKYLIAKMARDRIKYLKYKGIGSLATLNSADTRCSSYNYVTKEFAKSNIIYTDLNPVIGNPNDAILAQIAELTDLLNIVIQDISAKQNQIAAMPDPNNCRNKPITFLPCRSWNTSMNTLNSKLAALNTQKTDYENAIASLTSQLI